MTVFCTACGKPNTDEAEKCVSCGHQLKAPAPGSKKKFKGTMMMGAGGAPALGNKGPVQNAGPAAEPPAPEPPAPAPPTPPTPAPPAPDTSGAVQAGAAGAKKNLAFQKTMMGPVGGMADMIAQGNLGQAPEAPNDAPTDIDGSGDPSPNPISQPPGGFGPPGAASGFGPPAAKPQSGGFGPPAASSEALDPEVLPSGPPSGSFGSDGGRGGSKAKYFIIGGIGCLVLVMLACLIGGFFVYSATQDAIEKAEVEMSEMGMGAGLQGELARIELGATLSLMETLCDTDKSAEGAKSSFHPDAFASLRGEACKVNRAAVTSFGDSTRSTVASGQSALAGTSDCYAFTSGPASVTTCKYQGSTVITEMSGMASLR